MIGFLRGKIVRLLPEYCLIDVQGVGYRVFIPSSTGDQLSVGREALLYTYLHVREDALLLYGFLTHEEYDLFLQLITVSGIGPKAGIGILSSMNPAAFIQAIGNKDLTVLTKISGIGKKTAERIVLELKDKIGSLDLDTSDENMTTAGVMGESLGEQALEALTALGYSQAEVMPIIKKNAQKTCVEDIIKAVLREFGGRR